MKLVNAEWEMAEIAVRMRQLARLDVRNIRAFCIEKAMKSGLSVCDVRAGCFSGRDMIELQNLNDTTRIDKAQKLADRIFPRSKDAEIWMRTLKKQMEVKRHG